MKRSDIRHEIEHHLKCEADKRGDAAAARAVFGAPDRIEEEVRDARSRRWLETLGRDFRLALRGLRHAPAFTAAAVLTLALGIGANTAIFTWVNAELLAALPFAHADQLVFIRETYQGRLVAPSYPDYLDWIRQNGSQGAFQSLAWIQENDRNFSGSGQPVHVNAADVSANYLATLGVRVWLGRGFTAQADTAQAADGAILTYSFWRSHFGGSPAALGRTFDLDARPFTVIGVLPPEYRDAKQTDLLLPAGIFLKQLADRGDRGDAVAVGRLTPRTNLDAANAQLRTGMSRLAGMHVEDAGMSAIAQPLRLAFTGTDAPMLWLLLGATGLVLLLACANLANLMLVRTEARRPEWTMRAALGANRARLLAQLLMESATLALLGALAALGVAALALRGLRVMAAGSNFTLALNLPVLGFTAAIAAAAALLFGIAPALRAARPKPARHAGSGNALVITEVALALVLCAACGMMLKSFARLMAVNPGFEPQQVLTLAVSPAGPQYQSDAALLHFSQGALQRLRALPGVTLAALGTNLPLTGNHDRGDVTIVGAPLPARGFYPHPDWHTVSPGYFATLGLPLLRGRDFTAADTAAAAPVAVVSQSFAERYWPHEDPLGRQFWLGHPSDNRKRLMTVIGVVGNTRQYALDAPAPIEIYRCYLQFPSGDNAFVLRTALPPLSLAPAARAALHAVDSTLPITGVQSMDQVVQASVAKPRTTLWLLAIFGGLAMGLAAIGIYGVVSYSTQRRTREIGIRMALGADRSAVARLFGGNCLRHIGLGLMIGVAGALAAGPLLASQLYQVKTDDALVLTAVTGVLALVAGLACALPIRRACATAPWLALRRE